MLGGGDTPEPSSLPPRRPGAARREERARARGLLGIRSASTAWSSRRVDDPGEGRLRALAGVATSLLILAACEAPARPLPQGPRPVDARPVEPRVRSAVRCEECHEPHVRGWRGSAHARSAEEPLYRALRARGDASCDRCHQPLLAEIDAADPIHAEGVTCDVCHGAPAIAGDRPGGGLAFDLESRRKYGPLCESPDHYFHRMGCSPLHREARFCAACHHLERTTPAGVTLPVISDFVEWEASSVAGATSCQDCHMHGEPGEVARGWTRRDNVSRHDLFGEADALRRDGLDLQGSIRDEADGRWLEVEVHNRGDAHGLPAGIAGRRMILTIVARDREGAPLLRDGRTYARILGDDAGVEVPFDVATRVVADTRLAAGERRRERVRLPAGVDHVELTIEGLPHDPAIAQALGLAPPPARTWAALRVASPPSHR
ncbi:MAG: multiheme c-type cytochrome [Nannocystaceae bacterium]